MRMEILTIKFNNSFCFMPQSAPDLNGVLLCKSRAEQADWDLQKNGSGRRKRGRKNLKRQAYSNDLYPKNISFVIK